MLSIRKGAKSLLNSKLIPRCAAWFSTDTIESGVPYAQILKVCVCVAAVLYICCAYVLIFYSHFVNTSRYTIPNTGTIGIYNI